MLNSFHLLFNTFQIAEKVQELLEGFIPPDQEFAVFQTQGVREMWRYFRK